MFTRGQRTWLVIAALLAVAQLALAISVGVMVQQVRTTQQALEHALGLLPEFGRLVMADPNGAEGVLEEIQQDTHEAAQATGGPLWRIAAHIPRVGDNTSALSTLCETVDSLAQGALPTVVEVAIAISPDTIRPPEGGVNLGPIFEVRDHVSLANETVQAAIIKVDAIDREYLIAPLALTVDQASVQLHAIGETTALVAEAADWLADIPYLDDIREWFGW